MLSSRKQDDGLHFQNPNQDARRTDPGLNSLVIVQAANQVSGVGQGYKLNAVHFSEYADVEEWRARDIIDGDMVHALAENVGTFAILESTPKGAGTYAESLWLANMELAEQAEWTPLFLPAFFEKGRVLAPEKGWRPPDKEIALRDLIIREWVRCSHCGEFRERHKAFGNTSQDIADTICQDCQKGALTPYELSDEQLCYMWDKRINAERRGPESVKQLRQELCCTSTEAFQLSGIQVFPQDTIDFVVSTLDTPIAIGNFDSVGQVHAAQLDPVTKEWHCRLEHCDIDHQYDVESPLKIWEWPIDGCRYTVGVDVAEGLGGKHDFSVAWVNRVSEGRDADVHVATYRSNTIDPAHFAAPVNFIGRMYNEGLMSIEYNIYQTTADLVRIFFQYPNLYRWKHLDSNNPMSNKWHWLTQQNSKPLLWQTAVRWLRAKQWIVRDPEFLNEMKRFQKKDEESKSASAEERFHDDVVISAMISLYTSHDMDWNEGANENPMARSMAGVLPAGEWNMQCTRCQKQFGAANPNEYGRCPHCGCPILRGSKNTQEGHRQKIDLLEELGKQIDSETDELSTLPAWEPDTSQERINQWQTRLS